MSKKETINRTFSWKSFYNSIPWIILLISIVLLLIGYSVDFQNKNTETFFRTIGATALVSGLFSFLRKSSQYSDIYKEELLSIMYDAER